MYINISYKFHRIPDRQFCFITKVQDLLGQPSYIKFGEFLSIYSQDIERKQNFGVNQGP